jgi:hypothetical protein
MGMSRADIIGKGKGKDKCDFMGKGKGKDKGRPVAPPAPVGDQTKGKGKGADMGDSEWLTMLMDMSAQHGVHLGFRPAEDKGKGKGVIFTGTLHFMDMKGGDGKGKDKGKDQGDFR